MSKHKNDNPASRLGSSPGARSRSIQERTLATLDSVHSVDMLEVA